MWIRFGVLRAVAGIILTAAIVSCGKSGDEKAQQAGATSGSAKAVSGATGSNGTLTLDSAPLKDELASAGFKATAFGGFPLPVPGKKGAMLVYAAKRGDGGGMICFEKSGVAYSPVWHWFYADKTPESAVAVESNHDGLWDVQVKMRGGDDVVLLQDDSFTLGGNVREGLIALNADASGGDDPRCPLWKCFDGDSTSFWKSRMSGRHRAYIEFASPFGLADGVLEIQAGGQDRPKKCEIRFDGKKAQTLDIADTLDRQRFKLDSAASTAERIRLVFTAAHSETGEVAVAELELR